ARGGGAGQVDRGHESADPERVDGGEVHDASRSGLKSASTSLRRKRKVRGPNLTAAIRPASAHRMMVEGCTRTSRATSAVVISSASSVRCMRHSYLMQHR